jgi:putrescine transport system ATP-binding protein
LLRLLAGLEMPDAGRVLLDGHDLASVPPHRRAVNMMFQSYALFPHLDVARNVAFGLKQDGLPKPEIAARVADMLALVKLEGYEKRKPHQLSGGQRQRVAMGRALVREPEVFLLDEPLSNLDAKLRVQMRAALKRLHARLGITTVYVTHDSRAAARAGPTIAANAAPPTARHASTSAASRPANWRRRSHGRPQCVISFRISLRVNGCPPSRFRRVDMLQA